MALLNPIYIDANAEHDPPVMRALAYAAVEGQQGVGAPDHLLVKQMAAATGKIQVMPGTWSVLCTHQGGDFEMYLSKFSIAEVIDVPPVDSSGPRTDLVIIRVENPYVQGAGVWDVPANKLLGPYAYIRVITGVTPGIQDVRTWNNTWSAMGLCRIDRPANKTIVEQNDCTDLRSLAKLGGQRITVINNPPANAPAPPVAAEWYTDFNLSQGAAVGQDNVHDYWVADTAWKNWPQVATWQVPIPAWATVADVEVDVFNAQILNNDVYAQSRVQVTVGGVASAQGSQVVAIDYNQVPGRHNIAYGNTIAVPAAWRGKVVTFTFQLASYANAPGRLDAKGGTSSKLQINFKRTPS